jgi:uncharacterized protein (AIM24 family)
MGMKVNGTSGLTFPDTTTLASAGQASVRAWVNFDGTGTVAIRAAYNVTSITDNATGQYTVNFTTALPDANYSTQLTNGFLGSGEDWVFMAEFTGKSTTSLPFRVLNYLATVYVDSSSLNVAIFR